MNDTIQEIAPPNKYVKDKIGKSHTLTSSPGKIIELTNRSFFEVNFYFEDILSKSIETKINESNRKTNVEILDLGSGTQSLAINEIGKKYGKAIRATGIDLYPKNSREINAIQGDARQLPFQANSFDIIFSVQMLNYIDSKDNKRIVDELNRVLKPGGLALLHWDSIALLDLDQMQRTPLLQYAKNLGLVWKGKIFKSPDFAPQVFHAVIKPPVDKSILENIDQVGNYTI